MSYSIRIAPAVYDHLMAIFNYIAKDSPANAAAVVTEIENSIESLGTGWIRHVHVGKSRSTGFPVHRMLVGAYKIYYRVNETERTIHVFEVRHGARRQPRRFS